MTEQQQQQIILELVSLVKQLTLKIKELKTNSQTDNEWYLKYLKVNSDNLALQDKNSKLTILLSAARSDLENKCRELERLQSSFKQ